MELGLPQRCGLVLCLLRGAGFGRAAKKGDGVWVATTMVSFDVVAATKAGLFCASSEEEGFGRATKKGDGGDPAADVQSMTMQLIPYSADRQVGFTRDWDLCERIVAMLLAYSLAR
jgi:hypothetical protein